ncbi:MAG: hypothetical protein JWN18_710 [Parcubacteria group bacterium]|nr:hypothetical protein [Parcubacteria group bacterium]
MEKAIANLEELAQEAARFVNTLVQNPHKATLITLSGELGAGKTAFTKAAAKAWGVEQTITSPTFVLEKIYELPLGAGFKKMIHIDAYRLDGGADLEPLGITELMRDTNNVIFFEWPEKVSDALPVPTAHLTFTVENDGTRKITYG